MVRSLGASGKLQQALLASLRFDGSDYGSRCGCGGLGVAGHSEAVSRPKGAKGGSFPPIGFTSESPNLTAVTKGLGRVCGDTAVPAELRRLAATVATGLRRVLGQANYATDWRSDGERHRPLLIS
jgi:hypothetical protein